jgi:hypothetical protein
MPWRCIIQREVTTHRSIIQRRDFETYKYLGAFESKFENIFGGFSGALAEWLYEKN